MANRLRLEREKSAGGYEIIEFDPSKVVWTASEVEGWKVHPPEGFPPQMARVLDRWGMHLEPLPGEEEEPFQVIEPVGRRMVKFDPLAKEPSLYVEFANTPCTPEGLRVFANEFGLLGEADQPELVELWFHEIRYMRRVLEKQEKSPTGNFSVFEKALSRVSKRLDWSMWPRPSSDKTARFEVYLQPPSLLSAMWFQFALAVEDITGFKRCQQCKSFIEVAPGSNRPDIIFCSNPCRMRAYRKGDSYRKLRDRKRKGKRP